MRLGALPPTPFLTAMAYKSLHPEQTVTISRPSGTTVLGGELQQGQPVTVGAPVCGVRDMTSSVKRAPGGDSVDLALRLYTGDITTTYRQRDLVTLTYRDEVVTLRIEGLRGPYSEHLEIDAVSRLKPLIQGRPE